MRKFIIKVLITVAALYILFEFTIGPKLDFYSNKINYIADQEKRIEIKEKILIEMKKATEKEVYFTESEREIISNFIKKIFLELK